MTRCGRLAAGLSAICLLCANAAWADWNQWRGPQRSGLAPDSPPLISSLPEGGLKPQWKSASIPSAWSGGWGSPIVADGRVYLYTHTREKNTDKPIPERKYPWLSPQKRAERGMTDEEYAEYERKRRDEDEAIANFYGFQEIVHCFDAETGETVWENRHDSIYTRFLHSGSLMEHHGQLLILGPGRTARSIDAQTGKDLWKNRLPGEFRDEYMMSSFAVADGVAVVLAGSLVGLDAETGELLWRGDEDRMSGRHSSPVVWETGGDELVIVNVNGQYTVCVEPRSGKELWRVESEADRSTPVVVGDRLLTFGNSRKKGLRCFRISRQGAELDWVFTGAQDKGSSPVVVGDYVYVQGERRLACVELATGDRQWTTLLDLASPQYTSLIAADGKVLYGHGGLLVFAATPEEYRPLIEAKFNQEGLMAGAETHRKLLGLDEIEKEEDGLAKSEKIYQQKIANQGPLRCSTPALSDGRIYIRFPEHVACYDLRANAEKAAE